MSGVATPEVAPREDDEHRHLTVSSKSVAEYFKEKLRLAASKPSGSEADIDETPRGGIGSRSEFRRHDEVEDGFRGGLGMGLLAKMSRGEVVTEILEQEETPGGRGKNEVEKKKRRCEDGEGEVNRKPKTKGKKKALTASD